MSEWIVGNKPEADGYYWVTVREGNKTKVYDYPFVCKNGEFFMNENDSSSYYRDNVKAFMKVSKPSPYNPDIIGFQEDYYIKVINKYGEQSIYAKGAIPIEWKKAGYDTVDSAVNALKRLIREYKDQYQGSKFVVIDGHSQICSKEYICA